MNPDPLKALLLPFETGDLSWPEAAALFLNGTAALPLPGPADIQQYFRPEAKDAAPEIPHEKFNLVLIRGTKQHQETRFLIGKALKNLQQGGVLICAAANDAGGKRLKADLDSLGLETEELAKHKSRVVWAIKGNQSAEKWLQEGSLQPVLDGQFVSQPGIFGWDKIDTGSALLTAHIPAESLQGAGADFGCGYGYLAKYILDQNPQITAIHCLDADYRAIVACRENLGAYNHAHYGWSDLTKPQTSLPPLDWIVMNPPFHEGKTAQCSIGTDFIKTASAALKSNGHLWMVANAHLPYETVLDICFTRVEKISEQRGFKVFHARK